MQHPPGRPSLLPLSVLPAILVLGLALPSCGRGNTPPLLYILNPLLVAGGQRPSAPTGLAADYNLALDLLHLTWGPSIDPDTNRETPAYRLYLYQNYPPPAFYRSEDRLGEPVVKEDYLQTDRYTGLLTFVVTGYDGMAESLPSDAFTVRLP